jgi:hypothetical protein
MGERLSNLSFDEFVRFVFDHSVGGPQWYFDSDAPFWVGPGAVTIEYVTRLFEEPEGVLAPYDDAQLGQGFWFLLSNGGSDCMLALVDETVPVADRARCLASFTSVFRRLFAVHCSPHLSHLDERGAAAINLPCYMWWDILPLAAAPEDRARREIDRTALDVMANVVMLDAIACQESALHGLGHWQHAYPREVETIVDRFVAAHPQARTELLAYAESARCGCVL